MRFTASSFAVVAASASLAAAHDYQTVATLTSTTTRVVTLTECNPTVPDCPYRTATSTQVLVETSTSKIETSTSEVETSTSEIETSTSEVETSTSTSEIETSTSSVYTAPTSTTIEPPVVNSTTSTSATSTIIKSATVKTATAKTTFYPAGNTTTKAGPTAPITRTTKLNVPGTNVPEQPENPATPSGGSSGEAPSTVPTAAANGLVASSGVLGAAIIAAFVALY
ncbi:hypothetical protein FZEAL_1281 [Fusarium zealandicum]|uniref:GPI anchored serine-rich protein n=1 Tax=Fusarium zealandicum TaxID=1053134 RepID=A0A8H4UTT0_9HYPO|nr:hypothetical protein FZEAL_1281 [Fusarium zealandicum]